MPACRESVASISRRSSGRRRSAATRRRARPGTETERVVIPAGGRGGRGRAAAAAGLTAGRPEGLGGLAQWGRASGWAAPSEIAAQLGAEATLARSRRLEDQVGEQPQHELKNHL